MQLPLSQPVTVSVQEAAGIYRSAQRRLVPQRMLMRHMHMGIMFIIMAMRFIIVRSSFFKVEQRIP
jgi:hypothetical protein